MKTTRVLGFGVLALAAACSSTSDRGYLDPKDVEAQVVTSLNDAGLPVTSADCPEHIAAGTGEAFVCTATDADGRDVKVSVKQTNNAGDVDVTTTTIYAPLVEAGINQNVDGASAASCPDDSPLTDNSGKLECIAIIGGKQVTLTVTITGGKVTNVEKKVDTSGGDPRCEGQYTAGSNPECDACAAEKCCDELSACVAGTPCAKYTLCLSDCSDDACKAACGEQQAEGKRAADAVPTCMKACASSC